MGDSRKRCRGWDGVGGELGAGEAEDRTTGVLRSGLPGRRAYASQMIPEAKGKREMGKAYLTGLFLRPSCQ